MVETSGAMPFGYCALLSWSDLHSAESRRSMHSGSCTVLCTIFCSYTDTLKCLGEDDEEDDNEPVGRMRATRSAECEQRTQATPIQSTQIHAAERPSGFRPAARRRKYASNPSFMILSSLFS